jgi:hypothetical protein
MIDGWNWSRPLQPDRAGLERDAKIARQWVNRWRARMEGARKR